MDTDYEDLSPIQSRPDQARQNQIITTAGQDVLGNQRDSETEQIGPDLDQTMSDQTGSGRDQIRSG